MGTFWKGWINAMETLAPVSMYWDSSTVWLTWSPSISMEACALSSLSSPNIGNLRRPEAERIVSAGGQEEKQSTAKSQGLHSYHSPSECYSWGRSQVPTQLKICEKLEWDHILETYDEPLLFYLPSITSSLSVTYFIFHGHLFSHALSPCSSGELTTTHEGLTNKELRCNKSEPQRLVHGCPHLDHWESALGHLPE